MGRTDPQKYSIKPKAVLQTSSSSCKTNKQIGKEKKKKLENAFILALINLKTRSFNYREWQSDYFFLQNKPQSTASESVSQSRAMQPLISLYALFI